MVTVLSACYWGYDDPFPWLPQTVEHIKVMVTDTHRPEREDWVQIVAPRPHLHPRMAAKIPKCRPDLFTDDDVVVWVDASIEPTDDRFLEYLLDQAGPTPLTQFQHPARDDIVHEAEASDWMDKYRDHDVHGQVEHYLKHGMPRHFGLWATGVIVYKRQYWFEETDTDIQAFGDAWLAEQTKWTYQDQLSHPYLIYRFGGGITTIPAWGVQHAHLAIRPHVSIF